MIPRRLVIPIVAAVVLAAIPLVATAETPFTPPEASTSAVDCDVPAPVVSTTPITVQSSPPFDTFQRTISNAFVAPISWFDGFFFTERDEIETNSSYMRFIGGTDWVNGDGFEFRRAIRVKVRVPGLKQRLNLIFSDDDETDFEQIASNRRGAVTGRVGAPILDQNRQNNSRAGVGYVLFDWIDSSIDVETAMRSKARGEVSLRLRQKLKIGSITMARGSLNGFWLQGTGFGSRARLNVQRKFSEASVLHFDNALTQIHRQKGLVADTRLSLEQRVSAKAGISPGFGINAQTRPVLRTEAYAFSVLYRQQFFREWLFYEVEPGVNWRRDVYGAYPAEMTTSIRLEMQFRRSQ